MKNKGFTLIEIIIAVAVFAVIASITSSVLLNTLQTKQRSYKQIDIINQLQLAIALFGKDSRQIVTRPVRGNQMHLFPSFIGEKDYLELTRGGDINPNAAEQRSTLIRVAYLCKDDTLIRRIWPVLDAPDRDIYQDTILLANLKKCKFAYVGMHQNVMPNWYQYTTRQNNKTITTPLPEAIQLSLDLKTLGKIKQYFKT